MTDSASNANTVKSAFQVAPAIPPVYDPLGGLNERINQNAMNTGAGDVSARSQDQLEMMARWELILNLKGGTLTMREAGKQYLPQEDGETQNQWDARLGRTYLYNVYGFTVKALSSLPFSDPIAINNVPDNIKHLETVTTKEGDMNLSDFAQELIEDAIDFGIAHYLVDYPRVPVGLNLLQERELDPKPYFVKINPQNIIGWVIKDDVLTQLRIYESERIQTADFSEKLVERVRVIEIGHHSIYEKQESGEWVQVESYDVPFPGKRIPLVTIYGNKDRKGRMIASPLLEELAWLNLQHWQKLSDLNNIEHIVNVPFMLATGFGEKELDDVVVGAQNMIKSTATEADIKFIEHTGNSIPYSHKSLENLEKRMMAMGADLLSQQATSRQTAFAKAVDTGKSMSVLEAVVNNLSAGLEQGFHLAAEWTGAEAGDDMSITVGEAMDLNIDQGDKEWMTGLVEKGMMSAADLAYEMKRRGKLSKRIQLKEPKKQETPSAGNLPQGDDQLNEGE